MMFGGHVDKYDYHVGGLNQDFLQVFLRQAGYGNILRVNSFGLFQDTSGMHFKGVPISVNMNRRKALGMSLPVQSGAPAFMRLQRQVMSARRTCPHLICFQGQSRHD